MPLTGGDRLSARQRARLRAVLASDDPTNEIGAAWAVKERLRMLLSEADPPRIRDALWDFYDAAAAADMPETTRLATARVGCIVQVEIHLVGHGRRLTPVGPA
jgi:hypothetical protein